MEDFSSRDGTTKSSGAEQFAKGLGWFSIALGLTEVVMPRALARFIGVRSQPALLPALGLREITSGIGILAQCQPTMWVWSRVVGDAMDLALLGAARMDRHNDEERIDLSAAAVAGVTALDLLCALLLTRQPKAKEQTVKTITIQRSPEEIFAFWRELENLPRVMPDLRSVRRTGERRSHWIARGPGGKRIEWEAEITEERPNELISWRSLPGADVDNSGTVSFRRAPGDRGTIVRVEMRYRLPGGSLGAAISRLFLQAPGQKAQLDLYRLKQIMETGQITTTEGQPAGRPSSTSSLYDHGTTRG
jgi:uncharacterized membrane protein